MSERKRLWEVKHEYYCCKSCYFTNESIGQRWKSFAEFLAEFGKAEDYYNLVFRWDWHEGDAYELPEFNGDVNYRNGLLSVFFMAQRKGFHQYAEVEVCRADEPEVRKYLEQKAAYLRKLWEPVL